MVLIGQNLRLKRSTEYAVNTRLLFDLFNYDFRMFVLQSKVICISLCVNNSLLMVAPRKITLTRPINSLCV